MVIIGLRFGFKENKMSFEVGKSYWHKRHSMKVWIKCLDRPNTYITECVNGYLWLAYSDELEEIEP